MKIVLPTFLLATWLSVVLRHSVVIRHCITVVIFVDAVIVVVDAVVVVNFINDADVVIRLVEMNFIHVVFRKVITNESIEMIQALQSY